MDTGLPIIDDEDVPVYAKVNVKSYHNITGDEIAYLLQFRLEDIKNNPAVISYNESNSNYIEYSTNEAEYTLAVLHNSDCTKFTQDVLFRQPEKESYEDWYNSNLYFDSCE